VTTDSVIAATVPKCEYHISRSEAFTNAVSEKTARKRCLGQVLARVRAAMRSSEGHGMQPVVSTIHEAQQVEYIERTVYRCKYD
jgi:cell pole-organizing protein PopZ